MNFDKLNYDSSEVYQERLNAALEATIKTNQTLEDYTLRDKYFPYIESFIPKTEHILFRYIAKYEDKFSAIINSPYPTEILPFTETGEDADIVFKCCHIDKKELLNDMKKVPLPGELKKEKAAFLPLQVVMYLIIRYYMVTKQMDKAKIICQYYGYSLYWKRFHKSFTYGVNPDIMIYVINDMSYKNLIKKIGSIKGLLTHIVYEKFIYYAKEENGARIEDSNDGDIRYVLDQIQSDLGSKINSIADKYYKANKRKDIILKSSTMIDDEGTQRTDSSVTAAVESLAQRYTNQFFMSDIDKNRVKQAATLAKDVSAKELENTLNYVLTNVDSSQIHDFYSALFYIYLTLDDPRATVDSVHSLMFLALMMDITKKGNSINSNIVRIRELMTDWLEHGSNTFRVTNRPGTKTSYQKAVYYYFILCVTNRK